MFFLYILVLPVLLLLEFNNFFNIPIISRDNTALIHGDIISGWLNYYKGDLINQQIRFENKNFDFYQSYSYFDLLKILLLRLYYFVIPYRFYEGLFINFWNIAYFFVLYLGATNYFIKSVNIFKKNIYLFVLVGILSFHMLVPSTGTFRYQLSLIALLFIINLEYLSLKKNEK